ncbi:MAG: type II secretion system F family protein [bacterium]|nr:type II secretion system F family protein [bacterium]
MRTFDYQAKDTSTNKVIKSTVQADTEQSAAKLLIEQGFVPLDIKEQSGDSNFFARLTGRITTKDKTVFSRQLATLISAGLPLSQSLRTVLDQTENKRMQSVVQDIITSVEGGKSLAKAFANHPDVFSNVFLSLVAAGELSGTLDESLRRISEQQEKDAAMNSKIRGALVYPVIVLVVIFGVMGFMLFTVVPQVEKLYEDLHKTLPLLTHVMVVAANFIISFWWLLIIIAIIAVYFLVQYLKTDSGIRNMDLVKLNAPMFGKMFRKLYMARFCRTGQTLMASGVSMLDMLRINSTAVNNTIIGKGITRAAEKVKGGKALSASIKPEPYFMPLVPQMISIGEQSGQIDQMLGKTAKIYEDELDEEVKAISTAIEPVLMVVLAVVAGGMVAAILLPIYQLVGTMNV